MFRGQIVTRRSRGRLAAALRFGSLIAGLVAVTVAVAAWGSPGSVRSVRAESSAGSGKLQASNPACKADKAAGKITYVSPFAYDGSAGITEVWEALKLGYFKDLCLNVTVNSGSYNPQTLVESDQGQVSSTANGLNVMTFDATGGNRVVGVATLASGNASSLTVIMAGKGKKLTALKGQTFGYYSNVDPTYLAMFAAAHVPLNDLKFESLTNRNPITAVTQVGGVATFLGSQDLILDSAHVSYTEITSASLGLKGTWDAYYMNKKFVAKHTIAAENFLRADMKALAYCMKHTRACVSTLAAEATKAGQAAVYGVKENLPVFDESVKLIKQGGDKPIGAFTAKDWQPEYKILKKYGTESLKLSGVNQTVTAPAINTMINTKLISSIYNSKDQVIWP